jgi:hypothetical protein
MATAPTLPPWSFFSLFSVVALASWGCLGAAFTARPLIRLSPIAGLYAVVAAPFVMSPARFGGFIAADGWFWQLLFVGAITWTSWMTVERWRTAPATSAACAAWGAMLALLSMSVAESQMLFMTVVQGSFFDWASSWTGQLHATAFMAAHWLMALSVWTHAPAEHTVESPESLSLR